MEASLDREEANRLFKNEVREHRGYVMNRLRIPQLETFGSLEVEDGDIFIASFPKAGTTWLQQIVYLIHNGVDIEEASTRSIDQHFAFFERSPETAQRGLAMPHPRLVKTHIPYDFLPSQLQEGRGKVLYIARNPKDLLVSGYFFMKRVKQFSYQGTIEDYLELFLSDSVIWAPLWKHVASYWQHREDDHVFYITYEQLQEDLPGSVRRIAEFLNTALSDAQVDAISRHCSFSSMSQDKSVNKSWHQGHDHSLGTFMRKGIVGDWKNHFTEDMNNRMDEYINKNLTNKGIHFKYE